MGRKTGRRSNLPRSAEAKAAADLAVELPGLRHSSPPEITCLRVSQVEVSDLRKTAFRVKPRREFVGERFVVYEPVRVGCMNGRFVEVLCVEQKTFNSRDLGRGQGRSAVEIRRAMLGPHLELRVVASQVVDMLFSLDFRRRIPRRSMSEGGKESKVACLDL